MHSGVMLSALCPIVKHIGSQGGSGVYYTSLVNYVNDVKTTFAIKNNILIESVF